MKIYLASNSDNYHYAKHLAHILEKLGYTITRKWWDFPFSKTVLTSDDEIWYNSDIVKSNCDNDFKAIEECDILILVSTTFEEIHFRGANIELGYALALNKPCFSIGKLERCTLYKQLKRVHDTSELLDELEKVGKNSNGK